MRRPQAAHIRMRPPLLALSLAAAPAQHLVRLTALAEPPPPRVRRRQRIWTMTPSRARHIAVAAAVDWMRHLTVVARAGRHVHVCVGGAVQGFAADQRLVLLPHHSMRTLLVLQPLGSRVRMMSTLNTES